MAGARLSLSGISININGINCPVKRQRLAEWM
jgi:hypothetical protein